MYTFNITYDRHKDRYGYRLHDFPASYQVNESSLNYAHDPDWAYKMQVKRVPLKRLVLVLLLGFWWLRRRIANVEEFDRLKRQE